MEEGFNINEMVSEFRALRASVTKLFQAANKGKDQTNDIEGLIRFNEGIDKALAESVSEFSQATEQQSRLFETMLSSSPDLSYILALDGTFLYTNQAMSELFKKTAIQLLGTKDYNYAMPTAPEIQSHIEYIKKTGERYQGEIKFPIPDNGTVYFEYIFAPVFDKKGCLEAIACASRDISEKKAAEEKIWQSTNYDPLTELANSRLLREKLDQTLKHSLRSGKNFSLLFIDLDKFKSINDTFGHGVGDLLLKQTAQRIKGCMRDADIISRIGGDEFIVILEDADDIKEVQSITKKVLKTLHKPYSIEKHQITISASIGIALCPQDGVLPDMLIKNADIAMYKAKKDGGNRSSLFYSTSS